MLPATVWCRGLAHFNVGLSTEQQNSVGLFSAPCEVVQSGSRRPAHVGGQCSEEEEEDLSSAPIMLERDDLIGKRFTDNRPTPPCSMHSDPSHQHPHPPAKFPATADNMWHLTWSGKPAPSPRGLSFGKGSRHVSKTERNCLISPTIEAGFRDAKHSFVVKSCRRTHRC